MKIVLAVLLLALIPPVNYNEKETIPEPPAIFYQEEEDYKFRRDNTIIEFEDGTIIQEGKPRAQQLN